MAKLNLDYYSGEDQYSDGDIEEKILQIAREKKSLAELSGVEFPVLYHLTPVRENILSWYPFRREGSVLDIGSGCGAITGILCDRLHKVTSVELSRRRAQINYARYQERENLEIMVGNLNDMAFPEKFDYIVLNGVFEYAMSFTAGEHPYEDYLSNIAGFLKEDGILLVAIENRLGLKYFAGAPEDHTDGYMDGLKKYPDNHSVRTFSKSEWLDLMESCGLSYYKFYYPYPDYKFPCEIFTDETLASQKYGRKTFHFTENRFELFPEVEMAETLLKEGVMDRFANSFLIEMSKSPIRREREVLYAKLNRDRREEFAISTVIERVQKDGAETMQVVKSPLNDRAKRHLERMKRMEQLERRAQEQDGGRDAQGIHLLPGEWTDRGMIYPYLKGKSLGYEAAAAIQKGDTERLRALVREVYDHLMELQSPEPPEDEGAFLRIFGPGKTKQAYPYVCPANIDLILDNLFREGDSLVAIDGEWVFSCPVPAAFIIWRTINEIYTNAPWLGRLLPKEDFLAEYGIIWEDADIFRQWAEHFEKEYVQANGLANYAVPEVGVSLEEIRVRRIQEQYLDASLYLDTGNGYSEEECLKTKVKLRDGQAEYRFRLPRGKDIRALRFDPLEGRPCLCSLKTEAGKLIPLNAEGEENSQDRFLTTDPAYRLEIKGKLPENICITGTVQVKEKDWALTQYQQMEHGNGKKQHWKFVTVRHRLKRLLLRP